MLSQTYERSRIFNRQSCDPATRQHRKWDVIAEHVWSYSWNRRRRYVEASLAKAPLDGKDGYSFRCIHIGPSGGADRESALENMPGLKPLFDIHLSDAEGVPYHVYENALFLSGLQSPSNEPRSATNRLAQHLRIHPQDAEYIIDKVAAGEFDADALTTFVDLQRPRWKEEADQALQIIKTGYLPDPGEAPRIEPSPWLVASRLSR